MSTTHPLLLITTITIFLVLTSKTSYAQTRNQTISSSIATFPWTPSQNKTLTSNNSIFSSGFISVPNSNKKFIFSVYYKNITPITTIWSLETLVNASSGLTIAASGELRIAEATLPGSPTTSNSTNSTSFRLNDDGSLSIGSWSSFQHPTDTYVPSQNITGHNLTVKRGPGSTFRFDGNKLLFSGGYDNETDYYSISNKFQGLDGQGKVQLENGATFITSDYGDVTLRRIKLESNGNLRIYSWDSGSGKWNVVWQAVPELCRIKGTCGPNFVCMYGDTYDTTVCDCPPGFARTPGPDGEAECNRKVEIGNDSKFLELDYVNFTGGSGGGQWSIEAWNFTMCESACVRDIECLGFGYKYDGQRYCTLVKQLYYGIWSPATEAAFFLRVAKSETDKTNFTGLTSILETTCPVQISLPFPPEESKSTTRNIAIISTLFAAELISGVAFFWAFLKKYVKYRDMARTFGLEFLPAGGPKRFSYAELKTATNDFSSTNVVGKGGFGDVYKGVLTDHRIVAVKCLKNVTGGDNEFWAEVTIIARMHHLNLVRLWGFCAEKGQRILVYEYVPNGSLDKFLFQKFDYTNGNEDDDVEGSKLLDRKPILDWGIRYRIALGVARAIAYLHEECLEWVLHCDIKPENILLGADFCPKISDFGLSKLRKKEDMVSYSRMRGTRGYMAPEWVKSDQITPKADVYSFGMVLLEIVTGVRNFDIQGSKMDSEDWYFPRWAFDKVYKEMNVEDILDKHIKGSYDSRLHEEMITRMVKTAIWCLQDRPEMRPSMGKVAKMLEGTVEIIEPKNQTQHTSTPSNIKHQTTTTMSLLFTSHHPYTLPLTTLTTTQTTTLRHPTSLLFTTKRITPPPIHCSSNKPPSTDPTINDDEEPDPISQSPSFTDEWGEKTEPVNEQLTKLPTSDPPKDEDEWGVTGEKEYSVSGGNGSTGVGIIEEEDDGGRVEELKRCLVDSVYGTNLGFSASPEERAEVLELVNQLEAVNPTKAPTDAVGLLDGNWILLYTAFSELVPLLAVGTTPLLKVDKISQQIFTNNLTIDNTITFSTPFATFTSTASASFEVRSPSRIQVQFKEGSFQPPKIKSNISLPENVDIFGQNVNLSPVQQSLNPLQEVVANLAGVISGQAPLKVPIPGERSSSWLLVTYLDKDLRISRGDGGLFVLAKEGSPLLDQ